MIIRLTKTANGYKVKYSLKERIKIFFGLSPKYKYNDGSVTFNKPFKSGETYFISFPKE